MCAEPRAARYRFGTRRAAPPEETLRRVLPLRRQAGITRLADITGLDRLGIAVYQAVRPNSRNLSVAQGKGLTRVQAMVSALMEAFEAYHAEEVHQPTVHERVGAMRRQLAYDPYALALAEQSLLNDDTRLEWVAATELGSGAQTWVPLALCELNFCVEERYSPPLFAASSNGLASGNSIAEALVHGLCEVVERDSARRGEHLGADPRRSIVLETVAPPLVRRLLERFAAAGMRVRIIDVTGPMGVPSFDATLHDPEAAVDYGGMGCHPSRSTALVRALTEAAQSRLTAIAGSRDDIQRHETGVPRAARQRRWTKPERCYSAAPTLPATDFVEHVHDISRRVRCLTGMWPMAVDLTRPDLGIPVAIVLAPGLRMVRH